MIKKLLIVPVLAILLFAGVANANGDGHGLPNPGLLPGNPFYFLDSLFEGLGSLVTFGDLSKAERHFALAEERLAESEALADKGDSNRAEKAAEKYQERLDRALAKAEEANEAGRDTDAVLEKIAEATVRHQEVLADIYEKVSEQAKEAIQRAMENSARGHETALSAVSGEKQEEVRNRVEQDTKDVEDRLEGLRNQGIPIPDKDDYRGRGDGSDDVEDEEVETDDEDADAENPEDAERP